MARRLFEIKVYNIYLFNNFPAIKNGIAISARGMILCSGDNAQKVRAYFLTDESPVPDPFVDSAGKRVQMFLPFRLMQNWQEVLRNEKPVYAFFDSDNPQWSFISTLSEPVGEEES